MPTWFAMSAQISVLAYAALGGVFLAFSDFIMRALALSGAPAGITVMQSINREVFRWVFMALFLGMVPVSLLLAGHGLLVQGGAAGLIGLAGVVYLLGVFGVTAAGNVPLNEALAGMDAASPEAQAMWQARYLPRWTLLNSLRTGACFLAAALALAGLLSA